MNSWGVALTDVPPDPTIRFGTLPNGMKYAVMRNATPKGAASLRLHFAFGSLAESERERGLAHFVEHMVFNGSTRVEEGEFIKSLERLGMKFGPDTNALTGFDSTIYVLDLPQTDSSRVDKALFLLRESVSEVTFDPAAVERERGVILGERRARESYQLHQQVDRLCFFQAEAGIRDKLVTGVQTCALPISWSATGGCGRSGKPARSRPPGHRARPDRRAPLGTRHVRSTRRSPRPGCHDSTTSAVPSVF